jgi:hypothetical protein
MVWQVWIRMATHLWAFLFLVQINISNHQRPRAEDCAFRRAQEISMWRMQQAMAIELLGMT